MSGRCRSVCLLLFSIFLWQACRLPAQAQISTQLAVSPESTSNVTSSDDISVANGLQLPLYGYLWALDTWKGVKELVQLPPAADAGSGLSLWRRSIEIKGEAARVRLHVARPEIFLRSRAFDAAAAHGGYVIVRLTVEGDRRMASKAALSQLDGKQGVSPDVIGLAVTALGATGWWRLTPEAPLVPGEYAIVPRSKARKGEILPDGPFGFAIDPEAGENSAAIRSEEDRPSQPASAPSE